MPDDREELAALIHDAWWDLDDPAPGWNEHMVLQETFDALATAILAAGWRPPRFPPHEHKWENGQDIIATTHICGYCGEFKGDGWAETFGDDTEQWEH